MKIAIDGPAGSGKSTVAKGLAQALGYQYIDTGAMYRALTYYFLERGLREEHDLAPLLEDLSLELIPDGIRIGGLDLTEELRSEQIDAEVSYYSSLKSLREWAVEKQRIIGQAHDVIMDGRDIGTVVYPDAELKFYLEADAYERAKRRALQRGELDQIDAIYQDILRRDQYDSGREHSPLRAADDAIIIDTTKLSIDQVIAEMKRYWHEARTADHL